MKTEKEILQEVHRIQNEIDYLNEKTIKFEQQWLDQFCKIKEGSVVELCGNMVKISDVKVTLDLMPYIEGYYFDISEDDKQYPEWIAFCNTEYDKMKVIKR